MTTNRALPTPPRIAPVVDPSPAVVELYERAGLHGPDGGTLNIFATLAHHPALLKRWLVFATHVLSKSALTPRDRELLILRVGVRCDAPYEFGQHHVIAQRCDLSVDEIERVKSGPGHELWSEHDAALLRAVDELHDDSMISDRTWSTLALRYSPEQLLDLVFTVGNYHLVSFALNSCGVVLDPGIPDTL
ncbi:MAG: carboxymuconolactone decarboxylase family protein [Actinobacteria bacterium]|nr:carboxymuconolactone decarboxylase family protein [Actinomycetota bacterium]